METVPMRRLPARLNMCLCPFARFVGAQPEDSYAQITQIHTVIGGTGRFAGVQGSFTLTLYHDVVRRSEPFCPNRARAAFPADAETDNRIFS